MAWVRNATMCEARSLVLLLLILPRVPRLISPTFLVLTGLLVGGLGGVPANAAQRTFVLAPSDLVSAPDLFGAKALSRSATLGRAVGLKRGAIRFAKGVCPSLLADPTRRITRVRLLGGPVGAPLVVGRSLAAGLTSALTLMNTATWFAPASGTTRQAQWISEAPVSDAIGFATTGFATGDQTSALGASDAGKTSPGFRMVVNLASDPGIDTAELAIAVTTELPSKKLGKPGKRTECILVASLEPVDLEALRDLVAATPLGTVTRNRLNFILATAQTFFDRGKGARAARNIRTFALEVAQRSETEIAPSFAEAMINRANAAAEALCFTAAEKLACN
jgi:hypothetical protein